jgi:serine/threonine protein kinase
MSDPTPTPREHWLRLEPWLDRLLDHAADTRAAWLERECNDVELRRELASLITGGADPMRTLEQLRSTLLCAAVERAGQSIGAFRLLRRLGDGGMGVVYLAERTGVDYEQRIALKLMRVGLYDVAERDRFRRERQILARLSHPHIARLIEGGISADGVPYLAMEYVDGVQITTWCDAARLSLAERLHLFLDVCAAVDYAHRNLIVHRDLKPSNIFVTHSRELKLLDFGIAKLIDDESGHADPTQTEYRRLTPDYAAPEQLIGAAVTTATDVYALGVLLHQLLTGLKPLRREDGTLRLPSLASANAEQMPVRASARNTTAHGLRKQLRGDLDTLLSTALQPAPEQRYASAAALGDDIRRYLDGRVLAARRESSWYRTRKFLQRHRVGIAATAVFVLGLVTATLVSVQQARRARTEAARAESEAARATEQARIAKDETGRANAVKTFLQDLFESAAPAITTAESVDELLARGRERAERDFAANPDLHVEILGLIGDLERGRGHVDQAREPLEQAAMLARQLFGAGDARALHAEYLLARQADNAGHYREGAQRLQRALDEFHANAKQESETEVQTLALLGALHQQTGDNEQAILLAEQALAMARRVFAPDHPTLTYALSNLGDVLNIAGRPADAVPLLTEALARRRRELGEQHADVAEAMSLLASALHKLGRIAEAEQLLRNAVAIDAKAYSQPNPSVSKHLNDLGNELVVEDKLEEATNYYQQSIALDRRIYPSGHPGIAVSLTNMAMARFFQGMYVDAEATIREAIAEEIRLRGTDYPYSDLDKDCLARILIRLGKLDEAQTLLDEALADSRKRHGEKPIVAAGLLTDQALLFAARGDHVQAVTRAREAIAIYEQLLPASHFRTTRARLILGENLYALGQYEQAQTIFSSALANARTSASPIPIALADALADLARADDALGHPDDARRLRQEAQAQITQIPPGRNAERDEVKRLLAEKPRPQASAPPSTKPPGS